jgi:diguanylate cyclase (GGDEF)-like protein
LAAAQNTSVHGDAEIAQVAQDLSAISRDGDYLACYGGDEFAVVLPNTDPASALKVAKRMQHSGLPPKPSCTPTRPPRRSSP